MDRPRFRTTFLSPRFWPLWCGLFACCLAAILREAWNKRQGGKFDPRDIAATMSGSPLVLGAFWLGGWS